MAKGKRKESKRTKKSSKVKPFIVGAIVGAILL